VGLYEVENIIEETLLISGPEAFYTENGVRCNQCDTTGVKSVTFLYKMYKLNIIQKVQHSVCYLVYMSINTNKGNAIQPINLLHNRLIKFIYVL